MTPARSESSDIDEKIEDVDVSNEMKDSFLEYAYSVIYSRALPDARDGLKPVQRRILFQMDEMGLRPDRGHVKSARVVGEVMGKLHPHGDASIYDALVRLAQPWTLRLPLVDGHGNFGSLDDGPAAARYTEARLADAALLMTLGLDEDVVDFVPNYDNQIQQPEVLPAAYPNLLVNGASGIAVGMATNMAPHNLVEVIAGARHLIDNPDATLDELMSFIPGPDLPSGGIISGLDGIRDAYANGRGAFKTRAKVSVESLAPRKTGLVVTELPYLVGAEKVIAKIKDGVTSKKIAGISDVTDLTDRTNGLRLVIGIKTGFDPQAVLEQLYRLTPLEDSFSINNVALVDGRPCTLGLRELLQVYIDHRIAVVTRRSRYRLARREERLHLVDGLLIAILDIDEVIQVIRSSDDSETARRRLMNVFELSELQAEYILELRLRRLTRFSRIELERERDQLLAEIAHLRGLLAEPQLIRKAVSDELEEVTDTLGTPRRTVLTHARPAAPRPGKNAVAALELADVPTVVLLSATGRVLRVDGQDGGAPEIPETRRRSKHDAVRSALATTSRSEIGAVTASGRLIRMAVQDLPVVPASAIQFAAGVAVSSYLGDAANRDPVVSLVPLADSVPIALGTAGGVVKRVVLEDPPAKPEFELIAIKSGDRLIGAATAPDDAELVFVTDDAQVLRFSAASVRPQGRAAAGMAGVNLSAHARAIAFSAIAPGSDTVVATIAYRRDALAGTDLGSAKVSAFDEFPAKGRATGGVRGHRFTRGEDALSLAWVGPAPALAVSANGGAIELPGELAKRDGSGVPLDVAAHALGGSASKLSN